LAAPHASRSAPAKLHLHWECALCQSTHGKVWKRATMRSFAASSVKHGCGLQGPLGSSCFQNSLATPCRAPWTHCALDFSRTSPTPYQIGRAVQRVLNPAPDANGNYPPAIIEKSLLWWGAFLDRARPGTHYDPAARGTLVAHLYQRFVLREKWLRVRRADSGDQSA
jgi:hypothetical protein